jgi:hypothetical protein
MRLRALALQATLLVGVTATVGYPEFRRPARPITVWRTAGPLTPRPDLVAGDPRFSYGVNNASLPAVEPGGGRLAAARGAVRSDRPRSRDAAMARRSVRIVGSARTALNQPVPFAVMALRDLRTGRIEARARANQDGHFDFGTFAVGSYVVELLGADGSVIAASNLIGDSPITGTAVVRVSGDTTPRALFGVPGTMTGTTMGTTTASSAIGSGGVNPFFASTASEPLGRAADSGVQQTTLPDAEASPRN